jgi:nucleoside-diphosphate-sugar epimerase
MKILVTGANGFIGSALIDLLVRHSHLDVVGMVRAKNTRFDNPSIEYRLAEIDSSKGIDVDLSDIDIIVHTAGRAHIMDERSQNPLEEFRRVNTFGTLDLARLAADSGVKRFIFLSSIKVNGESTILGAPYSSNSIEKPQDAYGTSKYEAEMGLRKISCESGLEIVVIRPPLVYGSGVKGNFNTLVKVLSLRVPLPLASIKNNRRSMVGIDNLISLIVTCIHHRNAKNKTFLVSDNEDVSTSDLLRKVGKSIDKPAVLFRFPVVLLTLMAKVCGMETTAQRVLGTLQVDISETCKALDWVPPFSIDYGLKKLSEKTELC